MYNVNEYNMKNVNILNANSFYIFHDEKIY